MDSKRLSQLQVGAALPIAGTDDNVALMLARKFCAPPTTAVLWRLITHLKRLSGAVVAAIAVSMFLGCGSNVADSGSIQFQMATNRIAYIDSDGQLATVNPDGSDRNLLTAGAVANTGGQVSGVLSQQLPPDRLYGWPVWSPDGSQIAVSLIEGDSRNNAEISVLSLDAATGVGSPVFINEAPMTIADGTPHYVQWSPDGQLVGITAATPEGLTLFVADANPADGARVPSEPVAVQRGAPLYFDWSPDSNSLAVHNGEEVSVLRFDRANMELTVLPITRSRSFRTPAWSPDGAQLAWSAPGGDGEAVWIGRPGDPTYLPMRLAEVEGNTAFLWSSDGQTIAVADRQSDGSPAYQRLRLVASDGSGERTIRDGEWVLGFFWEPSGTRLAWVAINSEERTMEWRVVDSEPTDAPAMEPAAAGGLRFSPSGETFLMLAFFDQYARSHSPWAPDGAGLVVAGSQQYLSQRRNGSAASGARIYVASTDEGGGLVDIGGGTLAVWSTR